jgi:hypothetical protein
MLAQQALCLWFGVWLLLTTLRQTERYAAFLTRFDPLQFLPSWKFFAPTPLTANLMIACRGKHTDGTFEDWRPLTPSPASFATRWLWKSAVRFDYLAGG